MHSPRGASSEGGRVSVVNYDGRRLVNSPTTLEACRIEGIVPDLLLTREALPRKLDADVDMYAACHCSNPEEVQIKKEFIERKRKALVRAVSVTRDKLLAAKAHGSVLPKIKSSAPNPDKPAAEAEANAAASPSPRRGAAPGSPGTTFYQVELDPDNTEVAQYYQLLKQDADAEAARLARWNKKMETADEKIRTISARRAQHANAIGALTETKVQQAQRRAAELTLRKQEEAIERVATAEQKIRTFTERKLASHRENRNPGHGLKEREVAEKREELRIETLRGKLEKANAASEELAKRTAMQRDKRAFLSDLQSAAYRDQNLRAQRATEYRTLQLESRIQEATSKRLTAAQQRDQDHFEQSLRREVINRQKQEVAEFVKQHGLTSPTAPPPAWLEPQLKTLQDKLKASTARGPRPPSSPRSESSPRTARSSTRPFKVREPFTIASADTPRKQAFAPWMYQC